MTLHETLESAYEVDVEQEITNHNVALGGGEIVDRFIVDDDDKASWALRKLARIEAEMAANNEQAQQEINRVARWLDEVNAPLNRDKQFFESLLTHYHRTRRESDPKCKTIKLPHGSLISRGGQPSVEIDEEAFLSWATRNRADLVRIKTEPNKSAVKEAAVKDGEVLPGVSVVPAEVTYRVEVAR